MDDKRKLKLKELIYILLPDRVPYGLMHGNREDIDLESMLEALPALKDADVDSLVDTPVICALLEMIKFLDDHSKRVDTLRKLVVSHVKRRWLELVESLAEQSVSNYESDVLPEIFPELKHEKIFMSKVISAIENPKVYDYQFVKLFLDLKIQNLNEARLMIAALGQRKRIVPRNSEVLTSLLYAAIGRDLSWGPWIALHTILQAYQDYANPNAVFIREDLRLMHHRSSIDALTEIAEAIEPMTKVREVALILLDLLRNGSGGRYNQLVNRPAEVRAAYIETLVDALSGNPELRQATIEALLWLPDNSTSDFALYTAVSLSDRSDREWIIELESHPIRIVAYSARSFRASKFGEPLNFDAWSPHKTVDQSIMAIEGSKFNSGEPARTWIGDRTAEHLIERSIASVEDQFAHEYELHGEEGEDRLLSSLFTTLTLGFKGIDDALEGYARSTSASHRASVQMHYRNIDRAEEGGTGIKDAKAFAADLCIIVDPVMNEKSMGRRVTLVQAKRLYRDKKAINQPKWKASFKIDVDQLDDLLKQTQSSVYFFHGPPLGGRGVPVIPSQLVADLSRNQGSGTSLFSSKVAVASRSLAEWLTYDVLALRVGDPCGQLVDKAGGSPGSLPRSLLNLPTVEITVALISRGEEQ